MAKEMNEKIDPALLLRLGKSEEMLPVIVIAKEDASLDKLQQLSKLRVRRVLRIIHALAGEARAGDIRTLSRSRMIERIELDEETSITAAGT